MSQIQQITDTLKQLLREQKVTYKDLAEHLDLSEANIKRIFSNCSFSLERLEQICNIIDLNLSDLFVLSEKAQQTITELSLEQEQELVANPKLLLVAVCVRDGWSFSEIINHYDIDEHECIRLMVKLDRINLIQLLPNNNYKLLIAQDFRWIKKGPLEKFMEKEVLTKFMASQFEEEDSFRFYLRGRYSQTSIDSITRKLNLITKEAAILNLEDASLPLDKRKHMGVLMAMRPWEPSLFEQFRRNQEESK